MANRLIHPLLAVLLLGVSGCGVKEKVGGWFSDDEEEVEPPTELQEFSPSIAIDTLWTEQIGGGTDEAFLKLSPVVDGERIFAAEYEGDVRAFELSTGRSLWRRDTKAPITGGPGAGAGRVLLGTGDGEVIALAQEDGSELWRAQVSSEVLAAPVASGRVVVVRTGDGKLYGLEAATGGRLWIYDRSHSVPSLSLRGTSTPVVESGLVISGFDGGRLVALELETGKLVWEERIAIPRGRTDLERMVDIDASPVVRNGVVYAVTFQGNVAAVDLFEGRTLWTRQMSSHAGLGLDAGNLYLTDTDSKVWALDRASGSSVWLHEGLLRRQASAPTVHGGYVAVGDLEGYLHWLEPGGGTFAARQRLGKEPLIAKPVLAGEILLAYSSGGRMGAYRIRGRAAESASTD